MFDIPTICIQMYVFLTIINTKYFSYWYKIPKFDLNWKAERFDIPWYDILVDNKPIVFFLLIKTLYSDLNLKAAPVWETPVSKTAILWPYIAYVRWPTFEDNKKKCNRVHHLPTHSWVDVVVWHPRSKQSKRAKLNRDLWWLYLNCSLSLTPRRSSPTRPGQAFGSNERFGFLSHCK